MMCRRRSGCLLLALALFLTLVSPARAKRVNKQRANRTATKHFDQEEYAAALDLYREALAMDPESPILNYNLGTTLYKIGEYEDSVEHLQKALLSEDPEVRQQAYYNIGNAYYKYATAMAEGDIPEAIELMESALSDYEWALKLNDKDEDAKYNYKFVQQEIARLKERQQQQEQQTGEPSERRDENEAEQETKPQESPETSQEDDPADQRPPRPSQKQQETQPQTAGEDPEQQGGGEHSEEEDPSQAEASQPQEQPEKEDDGQEASSSEGQEQAPPATPTSARRADSARGADPVAGIPAQGRTAGFIEFHEGERQGFSGHEGLVI